MYKKGLLITVLLVGLVGGVVAAEGCSSEWADFTITRRGRTVNFYACHNLRTYHWEFGDGTRRLTNSSNVSHHYEPGVYNVTLEGRNKYGQWRSTTHRIRVPGERKDVSMRVRVDSLTYRQRQTLMAAGIITLLVLLSD